MGLRTVERPGGPVLPPRDDGRFFDRGRDGGGADDAAVAAGSPAQIGVWLVVGAITILFMAFTATYLVRSSEADWRLGPLPPVLWVNSAVLIASAVTLEGARRAARRGLAALMRRRLAASVLLGAAFVLGQIVAWWDLGAAGVFLAASPHASFFYLLTGVHGVHVAGGIGALVYAWARSPGLAPAAATRLLDPVATYWHFVDGLWLYVFAILFLI